MSSERSNFITIKKVQSFGHTSTSLYQRENMAWIFLWYDSQTSYLFFFSSQNATARMMRTPRMLAITTDTTKPKKRGKTCTSVNTTGLSGEGESVICHNACILHQQPFHSLVTPRCGCQWAQIFAQMFSGMPQPHSWLHSSQCCDMVHMLKSQCQCGGPGTAGHSRNRIFML